MDKNENMKVFYNGLIPKDWGVMSLGEMTTLLTNGFVGKAKEHYVENDHGVLYIQGYNITEYGFNFNGIKKVSKAFHQKNSKSCLQEGDLLTIQTGEIGLTSIIPKELVGANCHALVISRLKPNIAYSNFYLHYFNSEIGKRKFKTIETGSTMKHLNVGDMESLELPLPPIQEQKAIAQVLSTADAAIHTTEKLIAQKELRKKWLMQQFITGKKRLKGFDGEWKEYKLGELGDSYNGLTGKTKENFGSGFPFITYMNVFSNSRVDISQVDYVIIEENENQNSAKYGDFFFTVSSETPNEVGMASVLLDDAENLYLNSFCFGFRLFDFEILSPNYAQFLLRFQSFREAMCILAQGSTRYNISKTGVKQIPVTLPSIEEQTAIAQVLQMVDKEINLLKAKAEKLREQKKGLMQVLLTGKKRLKI